MLKKQSINQSFLADFSLVIMVMIWGSTFIFIKQSLTSIDPVAMLVYRFGGAALLLAPVCLAVRKSLFKDFKKGFVAGFFLWLIYLPQNFGMLHTSASNSGFITALFVVFVPPFSILFFKSWPKFQRVAASWVALTGLWFLTGGIQHMNRGDWITIISAVAVAFYVLFADRFLKTKTHPLTFTFQQFAVVCVLSLVWLLVFDLPVAVTNISTWWVILYLGLFATVLCFIVYSYAQRLISPTKAAIIFSLEPVFAAGCAWYFGHESLNAVQIFGGFLIVLAMVVSEVPLENVSWFRNFRERARVREF